MAELAKPPGEAARHLGEIDRAVVEPPAAQGKGLAAGEIEGAELMEAGGGPTIRA
jgi:hypothetical protein